MQDHRIECEMRRVPDAVLPTHLDNEVRPETVDAMMDATERRYHLARRYFRSKARLLGVERLKNTDLYAPLEEMIRTINESADDDFAAAVGKHLDLNLFMKYLAVESFMDESDGIVGAEGMNNFDLYRFRNGLSQFLPKDKDGSLASLDDSITVRLDTNVLVRRAMKVPALREAYLSALRQCIALAGEPAPDDQRGWLEREVERQTTLVTPAIADDPVFPYSIDDFLGTADLLIVFAQRRGAFVDCQVAQMEQGLEEGEDPAAACRGVIELASRRSP